MEVDEIEHKIEALTLKDSQSLPLNIPGNSQILYSLLTANHENKEKLQQERLRSALGQLERERQDTTFSRDCLFCRKHFTGNRSHLLQHLVEKHNFLIGAPDNVVFINELLDHLEQMLRDLRCFYCEKVFKDWMTLKEHMRKKQHKRINPNNQSYDRFYIVNYLEPNKTWKDVLEELDSDDNSSSDTEQSDGMQEDQPYVCLFCEGEFSQVDLIYGHMKEEHKYDFKKLKDEYHLNFYHQIKLTNFIRKQVYKKECMTCFLKFESGDEMRRHLVESGHSSALPDPAAWDDALYLFPTFEDDRLLCTLEDEEPDFQHCRLVLPEELLPCP